MVELYIEKLNVNITEYGVKNCLSGGPLTEVVLSR
jgi:hypothetical protein